MNEELRSGRPPHLPQVVAYASELLLQGVHNDIDIVLLEE